MNNSGEGKKVLIVAPALDNSGGVAHYYRTLRSQLPFEFTFFTIGRRERAVAKGGVVARGLEMVTDYLKFIARLLTFRDNLVLLNPSFNVKSLTRDYVLLLIAKLMRRKTVVFFRGWDEQHASRVLSQHGSPLYRWLGLADAFIVLSSRFRDTLVARFPDAVVHLETTVFDERGLPDSAEAIYARKNPNGKLRLLFLSRLESSKGVYECIDVFCALKARGIDVELDIAGDGGEVEGVTARLNTIADSALRYLGRIGGEEKYRVLSEASIMLFPSTHAEGMPNTVLEAMGNGMVVLTTRMGGIVDFFDPMSMGGGLGPGFVDESGRGIPPERFDQDQVLSINREQLVSEMLDHIVTFHQSPDRLRQVSRNNFDFASQYFYSAKVVERIDRLLEQAFVDNRQGQQWWEERVSD